jgi:hypothetical protein
MLELDDLTKSDLIDIMAMCANSTKFMAKLFFPERFSAEFSPLHDEIFELVDSGEQKIAIAAPRGIGKTSIVGLALTARKMLFQQCRFIAYVSQSSGSAELQTDNLKRELLANPMVKNLFGSIKSKNLTGMDETFSKRAWVASVGTQDSSGNLFNTLVYPRGSGQQIRGVLYGNARPDLIVVDDLEEAKTITNDAIRLSRKEWFWADLVKCVSRVEKKWQIIYIDTLKHEDSLLEDLLSTPGWVGVRQELCNDEFKSNAPSMISDEEIALEVTAHREKGMMDVFYREFRNIPISKEDASFLPEYFKHYNEVELGSSAEFRNLRNVVIVDPAKTVKLHSADSAIVGIGVSRTDHKIYVRRVVSGKMYPDELYDASLELCKELRANTLAVEVTSLNEFITQPFKNQMRIKGIFPNWVSLNARASKEERITGLIPYYRQGYIYHNELECAKLEGQLMGFPRSKLWDVMDALAYIVELLELNAEYFDPEDFDASGSDEEEYKELDNDSLIKNWRIY